MAVPPCGHLNHLPHCCSPPHLLSSLHLQMEQHYPPLDFQPLQGHLQACTPPIRLLIAVSEANPSYFHDWPTLWPPTSLGGSHCQALPPPRHLFSTSYEPLFPPSDSLSALQLTYLLPFVQPSKKSI